MSSPDTAWAEVKRSGEHLFLAVMDGPKEGTPIAVVQMDRPAAKSLASNLLEGVARIERKRGEDGLYTEGHISGVLADLARRACKDGGWVQVTISPEERAALEEAVDMLRGRD